jgi:hypothetical protein
MQACSNVFDMLKLFLEIQEKRDMHEKFYQSDTRYICQRAKLTD